MALKIVWDKLSSLFCLANSDKDIAKSYEHDSGFHLKSCRQFLMFNFHAHSLSQKDAPKCSDETNIFVVVNYKNCFLFTDGKAK